MYWEWFDREYNENQKAIVLNVLGNKWSPLIRSPFTGPMVSSIDSTIDMRRIVNTKGMALVVELSEGRLGQDVSQTLAQAVLSRIKLEILQRAEIPEAQRVPCTILIDEYSLIKSPAVSVLYRLSRNLSCTVIVMLQDLSVFAEEELRAITGNSSLLVMGVGEKEGERLVLELFRPTGTKKKSWTEERYYSPNEEIYIAQDHLFDQEPQRAVALMKPTGLYFMKTPTRKPPVSDPEKELLYRAEIATHWYKKPLPDED